MNKTLLSILLGSSLALAITTSPVTKVSTPAENGGYEHSTATVHYNGMYYRFYCSIGQGSDPHTIELKKTWDYIRMRTSTDGSTWSTAKVILTPSKTNAENCTCDPAIIRDGDYWYLYYADYTESLHTVTYVARSQDIMGPYEYYIGNDQWVDEPGDKLQPVLATKSPLEKNVAYGVGQVSVVKKDGKFHFWFTDVTEAPADPNNDKVWKYSHIISTSPYDGLQDLERTEINLDGETRFTINDFGDVKWNENSQKFEMWKTDKHFMYNDVNDSIKLKKYVSDDGDKWETIDSIGPYAFANNIGMSGDSVGWMEEGRSLVTFAAPIAGYNLTPEEMKLYRDWLDTNQGVLDKLSTYQFVDGDYDSSTVSISESGTTKIDGKSFNYYQFPETSTNMEFISGDFDGDGITDIGAVDRNTSKWYILSSKDGDKGVPDIPWGWQWPGMYHNHTIVLGDFDGDHKTDRAIVSKSSMKWYIYSSKNGPYHSLITANGENIWDWTHPEIDEMTHVLSGDYDGDGFSDLGVVDCSKYSIENSCRWYIISGKTGNKGIPPITYGWQWSGMAPGHVILEGDYDGDGKTDRTIVNEHIGLWYTLTSRSTYDKALIDYIEGDFSTIWNWQFEKQEQWNSTSIPIVGDFNGDGIADRARFSTSDFRLPASVIYNEKSYFNSETNNSFYLNYFKPLKAIIGDNNQFLVGDYDGDGKSDCLLIDKNTSKIYFYTSQSQGNAFTKNRYFINLSAKSPLRKQFAPNTPIINKETSTEPPKARFSTRDQNLTISNMSIGSKIRVFNAKGQTIFKSTANTSEKTIQLPSKGVYIIYVGNQAIKISIK